MDRKYWVWFLKIMLPHNPRSIQLLNYYGGIKGVFDAISSGDYSFLDENERKRIKLDTLSAAEKVAEECESKGVKIISIEDDEYPESLKEIYNPPVVLFVKGDLSVLKSSIALAVVGTRRCTQYGEKVGRLICTELAKLGMVLVSGFAVGLDTIAHKACVENGAPTVAVLACGIFVDYPVDNFSMRAPVIKNGALISELLPYTEVRPAYFHQRNRIISGLGVGTLIIEAPKRSGCLITAEHTIQQGRDLFCVPPFDITDSRCAGVITYLRDGAIQVFSYLDIVYQYYENFCHRLQLDDLRSEYYDKETLLTDRNDKPIIQHNTKKSRTESEAEKPQAEHDFSLLDDTARTIAEALIKKPMTLDEIIDSLELDHITVCSSLTELEINGYARLKYGGAYEIV